MTNHQKTIPWDKDEFLIINKQALAYRVLRDDLLVYFGAGESKLLSELDADKNKIVYPKRMRLSSFD